MFNVLSKEEILTSMLSNVPNDLDKREGSIIYDALAPCAYHVAQMYFMLKEYIDLFFVDTAVDEYLDRKLADFNFYRKNATYAERKIITTDVVDIGSRWGLNETTYIITENLDDNTYKAKCEQLGDIGNIYNGRLDNIDNVIGVTATLTDIILHGVNEEEDEIFRERFKQYLSNPSQNSNLAQYKQWAMEYSGIGRAKVFPLWNGGNTIKIVISNSNFRPADAALVSNFQAYIDPGSTGLGNGVAPIGSKVTVTSGIAKNINVSANVVLSEGYSSPDGASEAISDYLSSITFEKNSVSYMRIGSILLDCKSIADINNLSINSMKTDLLLENEDIPILNNLSLVVIN